MIKYTVVTGDTLLRIAYKFQTTVSRLKKDNPGIEEPLLVGSSISIKTIKEIAQETIVKAMKDSKKTEDKITGVVAEARRESSKLDQTGDTFAGVTRTLGQKGIVKYKTDGFIYQLAADGSLVKKDSVKKGARYRYYDYMNKYGGVFVLMGTNAYAKASDVVDEEIPEAILTRANASPPKQKSADENVDFTIPQFEMPKYKRTRMKVKKPDGTFLTIELRVDSFVAGYSTQLNPSRTNAGWMTAVGGTNVTPITMSGWFLDTKANMEARQFMKLYKYYFTPKSSVDYFTMEMVSLLHKGWEYQGLIQSFSMPDNAQNPLDRKFQIQFICFTDKPISDKDIAKKYPDVVNRDKKTEEEFRSNLGKMLSDPLTGYYKQDNM